MPDPAGRTRLPSEVRRQQIAIAARDVFALHGLAGAKTRQIADAANVTETILYRHFTSKEEIFEAAILTPVEGLIADLFDLTSEFSKIAPEERFARSQAIHAEIYAVVREITPLLGVALFSGRSDGLDLFGPLLGPLIERSGDAMGKAMSPKQRSVVEPRLLFLMLVGMYLGLSLAGQLGDRAFDDDDVTRQLTELVAFGLFRVDPAISGAPATAPRRGRERRGR